MTCDTDTIWAVLMLVLVFWAGIAIWIDMKTGGYERTSFWIHDDTPDWFMERVNRHLDKVLGKG